MRIKKIISDWSGVISNDALPVYTANMRVLKQYGKPSISFDEWKERSTLSPIEFFANHGITDDADNLFELYKKYFDELVKDGMTPRVFPDAKETFLHLKKKGKKLSVLSSHPEENLLEEMKNYGLGGIFDLVMGSARDKVEGLIRICSYFDEDPKSVLYLGDTIYDIRSSRKAGTCSGAVCTGYHKRERLEKEDPDILLENLSELKTKISFCCSETIKSKTKCF